MKGKVKFYNRSKDFGFIVSENGEEYYFNAASLQTPQDNAAVEFQIHQTARGNVAKQVVLLGKDGTAPAGKKNTVVGIVVAIVLIIAAFCVGHWLV